MCQVYRNSLELLIFRLAELCQVRRKLPWIDAIIQISYIDNVKNISSTVIILWFYINKSNHMSVDTLDKFI